MRRRALPLGAALALLGAWVPSAMAQDAARAAPAARLRLALDRGGGRLEVGEALVVRLEVWVSSWFQAPVEFPATLAAEGALVEAVGGSPDSRFEDFGGRRWTGLVRRYRVLPAQPGELAIALPDALSVQPGGSTRPLKLAPPAPLKLAVRLPAGAEDIQPFVAARRLELRQRWWPDEPDAAAAPPLQVGDLLRRELVLVTDSNSPLLPAPDFGAPPGVIVRVQAAQSDERRANAAATPTLTRRVEAVYTLQQPGRVELPPIELVWWDLARRQRRVARVPGRLLEVQPATVRADPFAVAAPGPASAPAAAARITPGRGAAAALLVGGVLAATALRLRARSQARQAASAGTRPQPRPAQAWRRLWLACLRSDAPVADAALQQALALLDPAERRRWLDDAGFKEALAELARRRFGPGTAPAMQGRWHGQALWRAASRLRRASRRAAAAASLPALHP
ncbi:MAG: hypothetical protein O9321_04130 [Rubrivivax sp.]|jgi:hypothetical protein|nr:hypothetical protein [Rubrivivax sp.]